MELRGQVVQSEVAKGSKSERNAVILRTADRDYILRRAGGNAFCDERLTELVGKTLIVTGTIHGSTLIAEQWHEV